MLNKKQSSTNAKITREIWMQRFRDLRWNVLGLALFLGGLLVYAADTREPGPDVSGTVISLQNGHSEAPKPSKLIVRLDDGVEIIVNESGSVPFYKGKRVLLQQTITKLFGYHRYYFVRYISDN
ncbi:MAG: hypothetical protein V7776_13565 [Halopseudomonas aestusnigri]